MSETARANWAALARWNAEARQVLGHWEKAWEALPQSVRDATLGQFRSDVVAEYVRDANANIEHHKADAKAWRDRHRQMKVEREALAADNEMLEDRLDQAQNAEGAEYVKNEELRASRDGWKDAAANYKASRDASDQRAEALREKLARTVTLEYHDGLMLQAQAEINTRGIRIAELEAEREALRDRLTDISKMEGLSPLVRGRIRAIKEGMQ